MRRLTSKLSSIRQSAIYTNIVQLADCSISDQCGLNQTELPRLLDKVVPLVSVTGTYRNSSPWFDDECHAHRQSVRVLKRHCRRSWLTADCIAWSTALSEKHLLFTSEEQSYWTRRLHDYSNDSRKLWRCLNEILLHNSTLAISSTTLNCSGIEYFLSRKGG